MKALLASRHVMHLDDDPHIVDHVRGILNEQGCDIYHAPTLADGLSYAHSHVLDAMIIDRSMPGGDGLDLVKRLRLAGNQVPALILSAMGDVENRVIGLTSGADDYLPKPFAPAELIARLFNLCRRGATVTRQILRVGPLELDLETHQMRREEREATLFPRETRLLAYLMRNAEMPLTRAMLLRDVWNFNLSTETNVIDVHMGRLRKKVDAPVEVPLIRTIKGVGFIFCVPPI